MIVCQKVEKFFYLMHVYQYVKLFLHLYIMAFDQHLYKTRLKCAKQQLEWRGISMPKRDVGQEPVQTKKRAPPAKQLELVLLQNQAGEGWGLIDRLRKRQDE